MMCCISASASAASALAALAILRLLAFWMTDLTRFRTPNREDDDDEEEEALELVDGVSKGE